MKNKRDKRGRILRKGESQRRDGRYMYTYVNNSKRYYEYSWTLMPDDIPPSGRPKGLSLREKEQEIERKLNDGTRYLKGDITVLELVERYIQVRSSSVRSNTITGYNTVVRMLKKEEFSGRKINEIRTSHAKLFLQKLQQEDKKSYSTIHTVRGVLNPAFAMAVEDEILIKNPFNFPMSSVVYNDSTTREAITQEEQKIYLDFIKNDETYKKYYDGIAVLFLTGLRVSELCGLTLKDVDFEERTINIQRQLVRNYIVDYVVEPPKTKAGVRKLPMTDEVYIHLKRIVKNRMSNPPAVERIIDGVSGWLFFDKNQNPTVAMHWNNRIKWSLSKYKNKGYKPELPKITPHIIRHTYCTNMALAGMNPKTLQYLMGHSEIEVTMNVYTHVRYQDAKKEVEKINSIGAI